MLSRTRWFRLRSGRTPQTGQGVKLLRRPSRPWLEQLEDRCVPSNTYLVTNFGDTNTLGTLRFAINQANANHTGTAASPDQIQVMTGAGPISVTGGALPALAANEVAVIDATTATGYSGTPIITLDGTLAGVGADGLTISGGSSTVKGFAIINFSGNGIRLDTNGGNTVLSSYIGITTAGAAAGNGGNGIAIVGSGGNTIGSTTAIGSANGLGANVISANGKDGIEIFAPGSTGNMVLGNRIGTNVTGTAAVGNAGNGIQITNGALQNTISSNVISGNGANGVLLTGGAQSNTLGTNFIGTDLSGATALGNALDGVRVDGSDHNLIGNSNPVTGVSYYNANNVGIQPVTGWEGIRGGDTSGQYIISGTSADNGLLFEGTIAGVGSSFTVRYPGSFTTSVYGPDNLGSGNLRLVGNYKNSDYATAPVFSNGFVFEGTTAQLADASKYRTIDFPGAKFNYVHSTMGGLAVGNYDNPADHGMGGLPLGPGHAFLYDLASNTFLTDVVFPGSVSNTAYGIWYNGGTSYTICGGYATTAVNNFDDQTRPIGKGYMVDYDSKTGVFSHWASFDYPNAVNFVTHFEGISSVEKGVYTLNADSVQAGSMNPAQGSWVTVRRNTDGSFGTGVWVNLNVPGFDPSTFITSSNSVYGNQVVGIVIGQSTFVPFQATINTGFQLSNVISGNGGNGIGLDGANDNQIAMNYIGTNSAGTVALGNGGNGILVTNGAARNLIGGEATGGNNPTNAVFVRPPEGNLISGNNADGVLIDGAATMNQLSGNFIGTTASGTAALGNRQDGVAIVSADGNSLIGCTFQQDPFVFYNVISSNGGNGLRIDNSNNSTVQANFFGLGADNSTPIGNALDGVLIEGSSANTQFGGVIPLGNVDAANGRNGLEIADTASGTVAFNTFCGLPAFIVTAVGNHLDGILVTSTGGNNLLRTNVISGNYGNGVHIGGNATGVQLAEDIIGLDTNGQLPLPNGGNGILIDGNAHNNTLGGFQVSVIPQSTISANGANGIAIVGNAFDNQIIHSFIGTNILGVSAFGNAGAGIFIGGNAQNNTIGGTGQFDVNVISGNLGGGIQLSGTPSGTQVIGNVIGADRTGQQALANHGNGVTIVSSNNQVGGTAAGDGNVIAFNTQAGVVVDTGTGNAIQANSIFSNASTGILLVNNGNLNQPAPVLTAAFSPTPTTIQVTGNLAAAANTTYTVEIFASPSSTPGQGKTFLGSVTVTTQANGFASFVFSGNLPANAGTDFTATAAAANNNTSALSAAVASGGNANSLFVASVYGLLLSRAPDPSASTWVNQLNSGATPTSIVLAIEGSTEYLTDQVVALYSRYLNRAPDPSGEQFWLNTLLQGGTLEAVAEGMVSSPEYFADHGSTNTGYVTGLYNQVLNRAPSQSELDGWVNALNGGESRMAVAVAFLTSTEYRTDLVQNDYSLYLGRAADANGLTNWLNALQAGATDQAVLAGILGSAEGFSKWS
jgi:hypothetical protein